jgi:ketosteroid isomerase-like protein
MRLTPAILFSFLLVLSLPVMAHQAPESDDPEAIKKVLGDYKAALERLDMDGADALFAKDNIVIENGKVEGSYVDYLANHIGPELGHFSSFEFSDYNVSVQEHGDIAWATETYLYTITLKEEGKVIERQGVASSVLHRTDEGWRIVSMHGSSRAPKPKAMP